MGSSLRGGLRFSGGCEAGSGDGWEPPVWWPCGWAGADQVWVSGWSRGPWVPGAPVTGAQSDPGQWVGLRLTWRGPGQPHLGPPSGTIPARGFWSDAVCACQALGLPRNQCRRHKRPKGSFHPWVGNIPPEEGVAIYSSILAWSIPWTEKPGRLYSRGSQGVGQD